MVGLGNPGAEYAGSRHNSGADTVALLAQRHGGVLKHGRTERALTAEVRVGPKRLVLTFPQTYYNESGVSVQALARRHGITDPSQIVVVHDELDLPVGRIKVKVGGGLAGNKGLQSVKKHLGTDEFLRIRIGVEKPSNAARGADHVLKKPSKAERQLLDVAIEEAADAVELILEQGVEVAMNRFNTR